MRMFETRNACPIAYTLQSTPDASVRDQQRTLKMESVPSRPGGGAAISSDPHSCRGVSPIMKMEIVESEGTIRVRLGNAGGVEITSDGKPVGAVGRKGQVKVVEFSAGGFRIAPVESAAK